MLLSESGFENVPLPKTQPANHETMTGTPLGTMDFSPQKREALECSLFAALNVSSNQST